MELILMDWHNILEQIFLLCMYYFSWMMHFLNVFLAGQSDCCVYLFTLIFLVQPCRLGHEFGFAYAHW
jgi:hypothetical protein